MLGRLRSHAPLAGIDFRATGTHPDWVLEVSSGVCTPADLTGLSGTPVLVSWDGLAYSGCGRALH